MPDVSIKYNGSTIASVESGHLVTLATSGKYLTDNITVTVPSEGPSGIDALIDRSITEVESNVVTVGDNAFYGCTALTTAVFPEATDIGSSAFRECTALTTTDFSKVEYVRSSAFNGCTGLASVNFPALTLISSSAFSNCTALTTAVFPEVTSISLNAFYRCSKLTMADFLKATSIGISAFTNCGTFKTLILRAGTVCSLASTGVFTATPFAENGTGGTLYVPSALISEYQAAKNWSTILGYANNQILPIEGSIYE